MGIGLQSAASSSRENRPRVVGLFSSFSRRRRRRAIEHEFAAAAMERGGRRSALQVQQR